MTLVVAGACGEGAPPHEASDATTSSDAPVASAPSDAQPTDTAPSSRTVQVNVAAMGFDHGSANAPVRVIEMSDYGCFYCRKFHAETWPMIQKEFVETGKIQWKFLPFVTGMFRNSTHAITAAQCAAEQGTDQFSAMNRRLWTDQPAWKKSSDAAGVLQGWAADLGLDTARYASCVRENRRGDRIAAANALSRRLGVRGTPTFFILGYPPIQGALPTETFRKVLSMVYKDAVKDSTR